MNLKRLTIVLAVLGALAGCGTAPRLAPPAHARPAHTQPALVAAAPSTPAPVPKPAVQLSISVEPEPNDYAHRNYCAEGAIAVVLSTWTSSLPSIDDIGVAAHVDEARGTRGPDATQAVNAYLEQITGTARYAYSRSYLTSVASLKSLLETDLSGLGPFARAGHGSPVLVHVRTATLPGWNGYEASHVVAVFGYDFTPGNPSDDTVTYAESGGSVAGYTGPQVQTVSLAALWAAAQTTAIQTAATPRSPRDPWTVIG